MSSFTRRLQRNAKRKGGSFEVKDRPYKALPDGGYMVLLPTKGWMRFSARRLRAQARLAAIHEQINRRRAA